MLARMLLHGRGALSPWYLRGGISPDNCLAAYKAKGAASYAASKVNLVKAGTYDLNDGAAFPTWDANDGWIFNAPSNQHLVVPEGAFISAAPLTLVCRFKPDGAAADYGLLSINNTAAVNSFCLMAAGSVAGDPISAIIAESGTYSSASTTSGFTSGNWFTAAAVYASAVSRAVYVNGGSKGTDETSSTPGGLDTTRIGQILHGVSPIDYFNGSISACAFYDIALSDAQILAIHTAMLALGL